MSETEDGSFDLHVTVVHHPKDDSEAMVIAKMQVAATLAAQLPIETGAPAYIAGNSIDVIMRRYEAILKRLG